MTYQEALAYLDSLINYEKINDYDYKKSLKLERMESFSRRFGDPHKGIKMIHVGGTKGKGSVSSFVNSILMEAGYKVGLYTSPHLFTFRERIRINGEPIKEEDAANLIAEIRPHVEAMEKENNEPTYFEVTTIMSFLYFKRKGVDFMVLEVGMGGRLDSTNIAESLVSIITPISYDHTQYLGSTLRDIALEKCGIIKNNSIVISSPQKEESLVVIKHISRAKNSRLYVIGRDILFETIKSDLDGQSFRLLTRCGEFPILRIHLLGDFQIENAATAVAAAEELRSKGIFITGDAIKNGLLKARWPGRLQIIREKPFIVVDGAQDANSASRLKKAIKEIFRHKRLFLIFGAMSDKDIDGMCKELSGIVNRLVATRSKSERASPPEIVREKMMRVNRDIDAAVADSVGEAIKRCVKEAGEDDLILITGSLYVVAEAMEELAHRSWLIG